MPRPDIAARLRGANAKALALSRARTRLQVQYEGAPFVCISGRRALDFSSNDYLGLKSHPDLIAPLKRAEQLGSGASALVSGYSAVHAELERELATWLGRESAVLFSTGFMANLGVVQTLLEAGDLLVQDKHNHASLIDAAAYAQVKLKRYPHLCLNGAAQQLRALPERAALLASDSVFSMDGDLALVPQLADLSQAAGATLLLDEAHALGVFGPQGAGLAAGSHAAVIGTFGKALGSFGAFVAGTDVLIQAILNQCRAYRYTTALPPALVEATLASVKLARESDARREALMARIAQFRHGASALGLKLLPSPSAIQPVLINDDQRALEIEAALLARGLHVRAIRPPTVRAGSARLRVSLSAAHSADDVAALLAGLADVC